MSRTIHKISPLTQMFCWTSILFSAFLLAGFIWLSVWIFLSRDFSSNYLLLSMFLGTGAFALSGAIFISINLLKSHIVTSVEGLEYHGIGVCLFSLWGDMENIKPGRAVGLSKINTEIVVLKKQPEILSLSWYGKLFLGEGYIPLADFGKWRQNSLGREIKKYAPGLLT